MQIMRLTQTQTKMILLNNFSRGKAYALLLFYFVEKIFSGNFAKSLFNSCKMCYTFNIPAMNGASIKPALLHFDDFFRKELIL